MIPVPRRLQFLRQQLVQLFPHRDNPSSHRLNILFPLSKQRLIVQDQRHLFLIIISDSQIKGKNNPPVGLREREDY